MAFQDAAQLRAIMDSAVDGIITIDERGIVEAANPAAERLFGYTASEIVGRNIKMLMPSPYHEEHDTYVTNYLRTGKRKIIGTGREVQARRKDGSVFPLYLAVSKTDFGDRQVFTGSLHDLTALKAAEQRATQFGRILEDSLNEIFIFDVETLKFLHVNKGALKNIGYTAEEMAQRTPVDIKPEFTTERFRQTLKPLTDGTQPLLQLETVHQRNDGSLYNVMVRLQQTRWQGHSAFVAIILDVTDRVQRDTELRIRNRAIQAAIEGIVILDAAEVDRPIISVNPAFEILSGYSSDEAIGQSCSLLCGAASDTVEVRQLHQAMTEHIEFRTILECTRKNGERFWNDISIAPVRSAAGVVTHIVAMMEDVSDRRHAQEQRLQSERLVAIGEMVTGLAHESRNALQRAQACLDMLALDLEDQPEQLELTEKTRRALRDLHRNYEEVRNYAAPIQLQRRTANLRDLWQATWRDLEEVRFGRQIELVESVSGSQLQADVDEHRIQQVFRNTMENAVAACPDPGQVTIHGTNVSWRGQESIEILFQDNGSGFNAKSVVNVFQPFFTTKHKGTGLGMAISRRIVEAHGGQIEAATTPDGGAEIRVLLPRHASAEEQMP
jgi:two-component system sensor kinase FixL